MATRPHLVFCGRCRPPTEYDSASIEVILDGKVWGSLQELRDLRSPHAFGGRHLTLETEHLQPFAFRCPDGHPVDGNLGDPFPVAVAGESGASKSHFLPAIVRELYELRTLREQGVRLERLVYGSTRLARDVAEVYEERRVLGATRVGRGLAGPYAYRLRLDGVEEDELSLLLFDVAGEAFADPIRIAHDATYLLLCRAVIYLVNPVGFVATEFDSEPLQPSAQFEAALSVRRGVETITETLDEARADLARDRPIPICLVIAKADAVHWPPSFDWEAEAAPVGNRDRGRWRETLEARSGRTRSALEAIGGGSLVEQIDEMRATRPVRLAVASATSVMPDTVLQQWTAQPQPRGIAVVLQHVLDLTGAAGGDASDVRAAASAPPEREESAEPVQATSAESPACRTVPLATAILLVALGLLAGAVGTVGGHLTASRMRQVAPPPLVTTQSRNLTVTYPARWRGGALPTAINLTFDISLRRPAGGGFSAGVVDTTSWLHLPAPFADSVAAESVRPQLVRLDGAVGFEFARVALPPDLGLTDLVTIPIDRSSALLLTCWGNVPEIVCRQVLGSVRLTRRGTDPRPDGHYAAAVSADLLQLADARGRWLRVLRAATTATGQADASQRLSDTYSAAARGLQRTRTPPFDEKWGSMLGRALLAMATDYHHLAVDARRHDSAGHASDSRTVVQGAARVDHVIAAADTIGFSPRLQTVSAR